MWWLNEVEASHQERAIAYAAFRKRGEPGRAMKGWFARAEHLLDEAGPCPERSWYVIWRGGNGGGALGRRASFGANRFGWAWPRPMVLRNRRAGPSPYSPAATGWTSGRRRGRCQPPGLRDRNARTPTVAGFVGAASLSTRLALTRGATLSSCREIGADVCKEKINGARSGLRHHDPAWRRSGKHRLPGPNLPFLLGRMSRHLPTKSHAVCGESDLNRDGI